jgi:DNA mismatch repair protein MutL
MGRDFIQNSLVVYEVQDDFSIAGRVSLPTWSGKSSLGQKFFINGRYLVRDRILTQVLKSLWSDVSSATLPSCVLDIQMNPSWLDCNVHPAKLEVRFKDEKKIFSLVKSVLQKALSASGLVSASSLAGMAKKFVNPLDIETLTEHSRMPLGNCIGIILGNYIVSETKNGMIMVDAHAAHERIVYEKLKDYVRQGTLKEMSIPIPSIVMDIGETVSGLLEASQDVLLEIGISVQFLDNGHIGIIEAPSFVPLHEISDMMKDIIESLKDQEDAELAVMSLLDRLCADIACRSAFRTGDEIVEDFGNALLREMELTPNSAQCQHGRPTAIELTATQIASLFGRK